MKLNILNRKQIQLKSHVIHDQIKREFSNKESENLTNHMTEHSSTGPAPISVENTQQRRLQGPM